MPMLESKIRRDGGTKVEMPNAEGDADTTYHFKPLDATRADSPHVADVSNMTHFARFIAADCIVYVPYEGSTKKVELPKPPALNPPLGENEAVLSFHPETDAMTVLPSYNELKSGIAKDAFSPEQLREFMAQEEAAETPRPGYIASITKALK